VEDKKNRMKKKKSKPILIAAIWKEADEKKWNKGSKFTKRKSLLKILMAEGALPIFRCSMFSNFNESMMLNRTA
jgi:hypothetical protein